MQVVFGVRKLRLLIYHYHAFARTMDRREDDAATREIFLVMHPTFI